MGVGYALIVAAGYSFDWPVRYLSAAAGALAIATSAVLVAGEEQREASGQIARFTAPPIAPETWSAYVESLVSALALSTPTMHAEGGLEEMRFQGNRRAIAFELSILRGREGVRAIEILFGARPSGEPSWTMFARPDRDGLNVVGVHPAPPASRGAPVKTGDAAFDRRFRLEDDGTLTAHLLDDGLRARATASLDGWIAVWAQAALCFQVCPGRGAPLDHPIPITELAFRGATPAATERMVVVVDLIAELAERALAASTRVES
jgi:hypothetical protein